MPVRAVIFDVGNVLYHWNPRAFYERLIPDDQALDAFMRDVVTMEWHLQHDAGRPFSETSAELITQFPQHQELILAWEGHIEYSVTGPVDGMHELVAELDETNVPIFGITNFSHETWPGFRVANAHLFDRFRDIVVSGEEKIIKPDPAIYELALKRFCLQSGEGIFIDDVLTNVEGASANGFVGHHFTDAEQLRSKLNELGILPRQP